MRTLAAVGVITPTSRTLTVRAGAFRAQDRASQARPVTLAQLEDLRVSLQLIHSNQADSHKSSEKTGRDRLSIGPIFLRIGNHSS